MYVWLCQVVKASFLYGYHSALHLKEAWIEVGYTELVFGADTPVLLHPPRHSMRGRVKLVGLSILLNFIA